MADTPKVRRKGKRDYPSLLGLDDLTLLERCREYYSITDGEDGFVPSSELLPTAEKGLVQMLRDDLRLDHRLAIDLASIITREPDIADYFDSLRPLSPSRGSQIRLRSKALHSAYTQGFTSSDAIKIAGAYPPDKEGSEKMNKLLKYLKRGRDHIRCNTADEVLSLLQLESKYIMVRMLGKGNAGRVFEVFSPGIADTLALKIIYDPEAEKCMGETFIMAELRKKGHKNFPRIYDAGVNIATFQGKQVYSILMDVVEGQTIERQYSLPETLSISRQIFDAICHLHSLGIEHKDLRPKNIMLQDDATVKIIDFGLSRTKSMEEIEGNRRYGGPTDLFSLGLITYELLSGHHLIYSRREDMGSEEHAKKVKSLKDKIIKDGHLTKNIEGRIRQQSVLDDSLAQIIINCLEATPDDLDTRIKTIKKIFDGVRQSALDDFRSHLDFYVPIKTCEPLQEISRYMLGHMSRKATVLCLNSFFGEAATFLGGLDVKRAGFRSNHQHIQKIEYLASSPWNEWPKGDLAGNHELLEKYDFHIGQVEDGLDFHNSTFDVVVDNFVCHGINPERRICVLRDIWRILKPGGKFLTTDYLNDEQSRPVMERLHSRMSYYSPRPVSMLTESEYTNLFDRAGFYDVKTEHFDVELDISKQIINLPYQTFAFFNNDDAFRILIEDLERLNRILCKDKDSGSAGSSWLNIRVKELKENIYKKYGYIGYAYDHPDKRYAMCTIPLILVCGTKPGKE